MKSPAFRFYATDYLGSQRVQMLTLEEEGAYIRLLCFCWQHGSIPSKHSEIARLVGKGCSSNLARVVASMFQQHPTDSGKLIHDRLELEKNKQDDWKRKCSSGGKKSAELKKNGSRLVELPLSDYLQDSTHIPFPLPSSSSINNKRTPSLEEVKLHCEKSGLPESDAVWFWNKCEGSGWKNGGEPIKSWTHTIAAWKLAGYMPSTKTSATPKPAQKRTWQA
jgi:uncharacterized protein YdaU (DUF1376 family)